MANIDLSTKFKTDRAISSETMKTFLKQRLNTYCKFKVTQEDNTSVQIAGKTSDSIFWNMIKFNVTFTLKAEDNAARISANGTSSANWVFLVFLCYRTLQWRYAACCNHYLLFAEKQAEGCFVSRAESN